jgi:hypothetical protein
MHGRRLNLLMLFLILGAVVSGCSTASGGSPTQAAVACRLSTRSPKSMLTSRTATGTST